MVSFDLRDFAHRGDSRTYERDVLEAQKSAFIHRMTARAWILTSFILTGG